MLFLPLSQRHDHFKAWFTKGNFKAHKHHLVFSQIKPLNDFKMFSRNQGRAKCLWGTKGLRGLEVGCGNRGAQETK